MMLRCLDLPLRVFLYLQLVKVHTDREHLIVEASATLALRSKIRWAYLVQIQTDLLSKSKQNHETSESVRQHLPVNQHISHQ